MFKTIGVDAFKFAASTVGAIGVGTLVAMAGALGVASWQRRYSLEQADSKDHRETAYQSLEHAIDRFTRQADTEIPLRLRSDWATMAHALETSDTLSKSIFSRTQRHIWAAQLEYFRRVTLSELKTQDAYLGTSTGDSSALSRFNHRPAERHVGAVIRWVFQLEMPDNNSGETLSDIELARVAERGLARLAEQIRQWRETIER